MRQREQVSKDEMMLLLKCVRRKARTEEEEVNQHQRMAVMARTMREFQVKDRMDAQNSCGAENWWLLIANRRGCTRSGREQEG